MDWIDGGSKFLVFVGNPGIGKTYHCAAVYNWIISTKQGQYIRYFSEAYLLARLRGTIENGWSYADEIKNLADDKWLIIDDIGSTNFTEWRKEVFFQLVNFRYENELPTMFTSNLNKKDFCDVMHPRVPDRIFARENFIIDPTDCVNLRENPLEECLNA